MGLVTKQVTKTYWQVEKGDDWASIAAALKCTKQELYAANGIDHYRPLSVGELLEVPLG